MALGLSSQEWDTIAKLTTTATEEQKKQQKVQEAIAKAQQYFANAVLKVSEYLEGAAKSLADFLQKSKWLVAIFEKGGSLLEKYPQYLVAAAIAAKPLFALAKMGWEARKVSNARKELSRTQWGESAPGGIGGIGGKGSSLGNPLYVWQVNRGLVS